MDGYAIVTAVGAAALVLTAARAFKDNNTAVHLNARVDSGQAQQPRRRRRRRRRS